MAHPHFRFNSTVEKILTNSHFLFLLETAEETFMTAQRYETKEIAHIEVYGRHHGKMVARLKNISRSGAFFELAQSEYVPRQGDMLCVTVHLGSLKKTHVLHAQVVWNRGLGFGAHFINKDELVSRMLQGKIGH
jgi:hypothetical protein